MPLIYPFRYAALPELKIKMNVYNKLKIAILAIITSQNIHAITLDPIQVQSAPGELLYAEINFRNADPNAPIKAGLASAEDLMTIGAGHQPPGHLNFFTRRDSSGSGVITITSSRPITDAELNIIVKISEGGSARLQHIKTPLTRSAPMRQQDNLARNERPLAPVIIANEKDIALNLPVSTQYAAQPSASMTEKPLSLNKFAPPMLSQNAPTASSRSAAASSVIPAAAAVAAQTAPAESAHPVPAAEPAAAVKPGSKSSSAASAGVSGISSDPLAQKYAAEQNAKNNSAPAAQAPSPAAQSQSPVKSQSNQYVVQSNESLWGIASRIAAEQHRPVGEVMKQIKASNEHAFIQGDSNRLRRGVALNLGASSAPKERPKVSVSAVQNHTSSKPAKAKYRLNDAEMSLVAEKTQDSELASANQNTEKNKTSKELSLKVMTSREKTVKLQRNVTQLELALNQKDHRIQLLNARLAQLQQQLKARQAEKKPIH